MHKLRAVAHHAFPLSTAVIIYHVTYGNRWSYMRGIMHMGLLPDTKNCRLRMRRERFPRPPI